MSGDRINLSPDEFALALAHSGAGDLALRLLLQTRDSPADQEAARERMALAGRSLVERGLANDAGGGLELLPALQRMAKTIARPQFTLSLSKKDSGHDLGLSFHFVAEGIVSQQTDPEDGFVCGEPESEAEVLESTLTFFQIEDEPIALEVVSIPSSLLADLPRSGYGNGHETSSALIERDEPLIDAFARDFRNSPVRGSMSRIDYGHGHPVTRDHALVVRGRERAWLLLIDNRNLENLLLMPATRESLDVELKRLLQGPDSRR